MMTTVQIDFSHLLVLRIECKWLPTYLLVLCLCTYVVFSLHTCLQFYFENKRFLYRFYLRLLFIVQYCVKCYVLLCTVL